MAYSQVEVASSSSFGCVLKDHNRRERCNSAAFQKNLKDLVRDHLHNCISVSSDSSDENNHPANNRQRLRCLTENQNDSRVDRWAATHAEEMVSTIQEMVASDAGSSNGGGASLLVQIWEARLNTNSQPKMDRSFSMKNNNSASQPIMDRSFSMKNNNSTSQPIMDRSISLKNNPISRKFSANEDSVNSLERSASDGEEKDRVRIVDIIKRLTSDTTNSNDEGSSSSVVGDPSLNRNSEPAELKAFSVLVNVNSPKIRGRQAFNDLLLHMEQKRKKELNSLTQRHSVSRFPHRGRIQAMLRLKFLQRGMAIQDQQRVQSIRLTTPSNATYKSHQGSTIMSLRERFSRGVGEDGTSSLSAAETSKSGEDIENSIVNNNKNCSKMDRVINNNGNTEQQVGSQTDDEESSASSDVTWQGTTSEANNFDAGEEVESGSEINNFDPREVFESTPSMNNWDVEEEFEGNNYGWFADISRPRSYWEDRRKEWYQEMLTHSSDDNEIKKLLERRTVSNFLESDFREKMDHVLMSHVQIQANQEDEELEEEGHERMGRLILSFFQRQSQGEDQEHDVRPNAEDGQILHEQEESPESTRSPSPFMSLNYSHHDEVAVDSDQVSHQSPLPETLNQDGRIFPAPNHTSSETNLMYDLRGHMEQLQREMSELRKAMESCMEMQAKLQTSIKQEVRPEEAAKNTFDMTRRKRKCCICYEMQVDSFLYRCGHMCTCLKCAHELQWSTGKCPICRAPILDVVRAYMD